MSNGTDIRAARIVASRPATASEWDAAVEACDHATFFHGRAWAEAWERATRGELRPAPSLVAFDDGAQAIVPRTLAAGRFGTSRALCSPAGTYGGWLAGTPLLAEHAVALRGFLLQQNPSIEWRINPFDPHAEIVDLPERRADSTHVLELGQDFDTIRRAWSRSHREAARRAPRRGVTVRVAETAEDWNAYDSVYRASVARWGDAASAEHPRAIFDELRTLDDVRLWIAERGGEVVAGALCCYTKHHVAYWNGAGLAEHFDAKPMQRVMHDAIEHAVGLGARWFDFHPSGDHRGTRTFKQRFGATELPAPVIDRRAPVRSLVHGLTSLMRFDR